MSPPESSASEKERPPSGPAPDVKGPRATVVAAWITGAAVVLGAIAAAVIGLRSDSVPSQTTSGSSSPIINATGGSTVNVSQNEPQLSQSERKDIEERFRAVGSLQRFDVRIDSDYDAVNAWLGEFIATKDRKLLSPVLFIFSVRESGGDSASYARKTPMEIRDILVGYRREKRLGLTLEFAPDGVIPMRGSDVLRFSTSLPGAPGSEPPNAAGALPAK